MEPLPLDRPLTLASYDAIRGLPQAIEEHVGIGDPLAAMPLYLIGESYVEAPLENTYHAAFRGMPEYWRDVLGKPAAPSA